MIRRIYLYDESLSTLLNNSLNLHFDSINFSVISALCGKGNLEPVRCAGARTTPSNERKALSSIIRNADPSTTRGNLQYGAHHGPKLRDGNLVVVRIWITKTERTCNECAFISFHSYVIARSIAVCYGLIKIPAINYTLNCWTDFINEFVFDFLAAKRDEWNISKSFAGGILYIYVNILKKNVLKISLYFAIVSSIVIFLNEIILYYTSYFVFSSFK